MQDHWCRVEQTKLVQCLAGRKLKRGKGNQGRLRTEVAEGCTVGAVHLHRGHRVRDLASHPTHTGPSRAHAAHQVVGSEEAVLLQTTGACEQEGLTPCTWSVQGAFRSLSCQAPAHNSPNYQYRNS